jgi:hypothetical protein
MAAKSAMLVEPNTAPAAPAAKAANSILPSSPMSTTPERSENSPARAHKISGVASRRVEASMAPKEASSMAHSRQPRQQAQGR